MNESFTSGSYEEMAKCHRNYGLELKTATLRLAWLKPASALSDILEIPPESAEARAHDRLLKVARTIADLDHAERVSAKHLAETVQYRTLDRNYWQ
jgi:predicted ATPase with chaperone activity